MITFTKEQLIASAHARIEFAEMMLAGELEPLKERTWSIELELARIALASLEAEHAGFIVKHKITGKFGSWLHSKADWFRSDEYEVLSAYTAPPATVSMKDHQIRDLVNELRDISVEYHGTQQLRERIARTIRAAMLQGAELVTTANKLRDAVETIRNSGIEIDAEKIFAERDALNAPVIPDGYCIMPLKLTADNGAKGALCGEFHVQYRIVCQSCVGEGCEDCNHTGGWDAEIPVGWDTIKRIHEAAVEACAMPAAPQQEVK